MLGTKKRLCSPWDLSAASYVASYVFRDSRVSVICELRLLFFARLVSFAWQSMSLTTLGTGNECSLLLRRSLVAIVASSTQRYYHVRCSLLAKCCQTNTRLSAAP